MNEVLRNIPRPRGDTAGSGAETQSVLACFSLAVGTWPEVNLIRSELSFPENRLLELANIAANKNTMYAYALSILLSNVLHLRFCFISSNLLFSHTLSLANEYIFSKVLLICLVFVCLFIIHTHTHSLSLTNIYFQKYC